MSERAYFDVIGGRGHFFRGLGLAEFEAWKQANMLTPEFGGMEFGKHITVLPKLARRWRELLPEADKPGGVIHILQIALPLEVAQALYFLGPNVDGIGPAYFATYEQLKTAIIEEVWI